MAKIIIISNRKQFYYKKAIFCLGEIILSNSSKIYKSPIDILHKIISKRLFCNYSCMIMEYINFT